MSAEDAPEPRRAEENERLRAVFAAGQDSLENRLEIRAGEGNDCAEPEQIFELARGALAQDAALRIAEHCLGCAGCGLALRLAREVVAQVEPSPPPHEGAPPRPLPAWRWMFIGLSSLAAAAALLFFVRATPAPVYRAEAVELSSQLDTQALPREQFVLRWSALGAGARYSVNVATPGLDVLFARGGLASPEVQVPASALAKVPAGGQVVWRVTALLADGRRIESTAFLTAVR